MSEIMNVSPAEFRQRLETLRQGLAALGGYL